MNSVALIRNTFNDIITLSLHITHYCMTLYSARNVLGQVPVRSVNLVES
jgi:hypothetical protein